MSVTRRKLLFTVATLALLLGGAEAVLRLVDFRYQPFPEQIWLGRLKGGIPTAEVVFDEVVPGLFTRDARLFWRPVAGRAPFNAAGLRATDELPAERPSDELRLLALGDSCTFLGEPLPWTDVLERRLSGGARSVRVLNAGVPAWTSLQGRRYLEAPGLSFAPDVVLVYFGWNDHWRATTRPDAAFPVSAESVVAVQRLLSHSRLYQGLNRLLKGRAPPGDVGPPAADEDLATAALSRPFRVPEADFETNLRDIQRLSAGADARVAFITAPSHLFATAVPTYLLAHGFVAPDGDAVEVIHARYAAVVRRVARETGALLVDAAAAFAAEPDGGRALLRDDGIHLTAAGIERLAELIAGELQRGDALD